MHRARRSSTMRSLLERGKWPTLPKGRKRGSIRGALLRDSGGRTVSEGRFRHRGRWYVLALVAALVFGAVAAVPAFASAEEKAFEPRVVGGKPVPEGKYPFM